MSGWLLDTNVLSELTRSRPDPGVISFLDGLSQGFLSVVTIHELTWGLAALPHGQRREALTRAVDDLLTQFSDCVLPVGAAEARACAHLRAIARGQGRTLHLADGLIAATALTHGLGIVTRNIRDFEGLEIPLLDPWTEG